MRADLDKDFPEFLHLDGEVDGGVQVLQVKEGGQGLHDVPRQVHVRREQANLAGGRNHHVNGF